MNLFTIGFFLSFNIWALYIKILDHPVEAEENCKVLGTRRTFGMELNTKGTSLGHCSFGSPGK